jgi:uncharacterized protein YjbI with pentapeptide repeats
MPSEPRKRSSGSEEKMSAWVSSNPLLLGIGVFAAGVLVLWPLVALITFQPGTTVATSVKTDSQGKVLETTTTTTPDDEKTAWDWVGLLGVPFALTGFGVLQQLRSEKQAQAEKERSEAQAQAEKNIAESYQREEALQNYLDRLSELLIEKNLIGKVGRVQATGEEQSKDNRTDLVKLEEKEMLDTASDVIRARTLSILRRLGEDGGRKGAVIQFLIEAEVIGKLKLNLRGADLTGAKLTSADLSEVNLSKVNLRGADLTGAKLTGAKLWSAKLSGAKLWLAKLSGADLSSADLTSADLSRGDLSGADLWLAKLSGADLSGADLSSVKNWTEDQLAEARLSNTKLPAGCNLNPNRDTGRDRFLSL